MQDYSKLTTLTHVDNEKMWKHSGDLEICLVHFSPVGGSLQVVTSANHIVTFLKQVGVSSLIHLFIRLCIIC